MKENRRELMKKVFNNEEASRVPVGLWHHFVSPRDHFRALEDEAVLQACIDGHKKMFDEMEPDFLKIMADGFFGHPSMMTTKINTTADLYNIKSVGENHPWITEQVKYVKLVNDYAKDEVLTFYSIFSPLQFVSLYFEEYEEDMQKFDRLFLEDPQAMLAAAAEIAKDVKTLVKKLHEEVELDGIYYSLKNIQLRKEEKEFHAEFHKKYMAPVDRDVLDYINELYPLSLMHICGWGSFTNRLEYYTEYGAKVLNWATHTEKVSLLDGKKLFSGSPVIGGFDNNKGTLLYDGTDAEVESYVKSIIDECGKTGIIIGADCTISPDLPYERVKFIRDVAKAYCEK